MNPELCVLPIWGHLNENYCWKWCILHKIVSVVPYCLSGPQMKSVLWLTHLKMQYYRSSKLGMMSQDSNPRAPEAKAGWQRTPIPNKQKQVSFAINHIHIVSLEVMITHSRVKNEKQDNILFYFVQPFKSHMYMLYSGKKKMVYESKCHLKVMKQFQKYTTLTFISGMVVKKFAYPGEIVNSEIPRIILMKQINATETMPNTKQNQRASQ